MVDRAFQREQAQAIERGLPEKILLLLEKRGPVGLKQNQFFEIIRGVTMDNLRVELSRLEGEGLLTILWHGTEDFTAVITPRGSQATKEFSAWDEE